MESQAILEDAVVRRLMDVGGAGFVDEMIDLFAAQAPALIGRAEAALGSEDLDGVRRAAHTLVSVAGNLGARELQRLAADVEQCALRGDRAGIGGVVDAMAPACARARDALVASRVARAG
jgi:HPt (histidine-containing phosphotransfer) domain-containing protein